MSKALTYVELDIPICSLTYGSAPCTASVPTTGAQKCFNSKANCQDTAHYAASTVTLRFGPQAYYRPKDIDCIPCIDSVEHTPGTVGLDGSLGERTMLRVVLRDEKHSDTGAGFDKYLSTRSYNPYEQGTLFGKFRARQPYLRGAALRWYRGVLGDTIASMEMRAYVVDSVDGPDQNGFFTIVAKDPLKLLDGERAQAPAMSTGFLSADITDTDTAMTLLPVGIGLAEHPLGSGYMTLGGNEIVGYGHDITDGNDADTVLYLEFDGVDEASTTVDSSAAALTVSRVGSAKIDSFHYKFGGTATQLGAVSGDGWSVPDAATWTFAGNFTIDAFVWPGSFASDQTVAGQSESSTKRYRLYIKTNGSLNFEILNTSTVLQFGSAASALTTGTVGGFQHVAIERFGNVWTLFVNGAVVATTTAAVSIPSLAATFRCGIANGSTLGWGGWIDNCRVSKVARYSGAAFTPPATRYQSPDIFSITRGQLNTTASSHQADDRAQVVLIYSAQSPEDIIYDLEVTYGLVPASYISLPTWAAEIAAHQPQVYSAALPIATPVKQLVEEICTAAGLAHWWNDTSQLLELQVIRNAPSATVIAEKDRINETFQAKDLPEKRISRVQVYFGMVDPTKEVSDISNFRGMKETADATAEANFGNVVIKQVTTRWIPESGSAIAAALGTVLLARYKAVVRRFNFSVMRTLGLVPQPGAAYQLTAPFLQDADGSAIEVPFQVTRINPGPAIIEVEGEEMLAPAAPADPNDHTIVIASNTNSFNLRAVHDATFADATATTIVTVIINAGVVVGSTSATVPAFDTGDWSDIPGVTLVLENNGTIEGAGGYGGLGAIATANSGGTVTSSTNAQAGQNGGTALKAQEDIEVAGGGVVKGGGAGGGGGGCGHAASATKGGGAAGGGAGQTGGSGAAARTDKLDAGGNGSLAAGGLGKNGSGGGYGKIGGNGGAPGADGTNGTTLVPGGSGGSWNTGGTKGTGGKAVDGNSHVTETGTVVFTGTRV